MIEWAQVGQVFVDSLGWASTAIGGAMATLPDIARTAVEQRHWVDAPSMARLTSIGQATPGPNMLVVGLVGWKAAGIPGAVAAMLAFVLPSAFAIVALRPHWEAAKSKPWAKALRQSFAALAVGLMFAGTLAFASIAEMSPAMAAIAAGSAALALKSKSSAAMIIAAGAAAGMALL